MNKKFLIVLHEKDVAYKVLKIVFLPDGGFCFFMPYHNAQNGLLTKSRVNYKEFESISFFEEKYTYTADDDVKISYHPDGFIQFSTAGSSKIVSGKDPSTGEAKGLNIKIEPFATRLIKTGPTFGGILWGLQEFERFNSAKKNEIAIEFSEEHFNYQYCTPDNWNTYNIECFLFDRKRYINSVVNDEYSNKYLNLLHLNYHEGPTWFSHRILPFFERDYMVGVLIFRTHANWHCDSGYSFSSASQIINESEAYMLTALYPRRMCEKEYKSLMYQD